MTATADVQQAVELLQQWRDDLQLVGPAPPRLIQDAEEALGVVFPPSYRSFLVALGGGSILGREIYGIVHDLSAAGPPNVVWITLNSRRVEGLPDRFVLVAHLDDSSAFALDARRSDSDGESPVLRIWPGEPEEELVHSEAAASFGSFFLQFTRERIDISSN